METKQYFARESFNETQLRLIAKAMSWEAAKGGLIAGWCETALAGTATQWFAYKAANCSLQAYVESGECSDAERALAPIITDVLRWRMSNSFEFNTDRVY